MSASGRLIHEAGGTRFEVRFGRPAARGREIFGGVVPYGQVWRTGADEATVVAFEDDVRINGGPLPRGVYALFTIPYAHEWVVIFNERAEQWGASAYDEDEDALRVAIAPRPLDPPVEVLDIVGTEQGFALRWADVEIPVRVQRDTSSPTARPAFGEP